MGEEVEEVEEEDDPVGCQRSDMIHKVDLKCAGSKAGCDWSGGDCSQQL